MDNIKNIYCINVRLSEERRERMMKRFIKSGLHEKAKFIEAVELDTNLFDYYYDKDSYYGIHEDNIEAEKRVASCLASHLKAIRFFLSESKDKEYAIICEDDVQLHNNFIEKFNDVWNNMPDNCPLISLGYLIWHWEDLEWAGKNIDIENISTMNWDTWGTQMYLISTEYAKKVLELYDRPFENIELDKEDNNAIVTSELITRNSGGYISYPPLVLEEIGPSEITGETAEDMNHHEALKDFDYDMYSKYES